MAEDLPVAAPGMDKDPPEAPEEAPASKKQDRYREDRRTVTMQPPHREASTAEEAEGAQ